MKFLRYLLLALIPALAFPQANVTRGGTGGLVVQQSGLTIPAPILVTPALGTPVSGVATNLTGTATGLTAGTASAVAVGGITGLGTGVGAALTVNVGTAGAPVLLNGAGGTPSSLVGTNITGTAAGLTAGAASAIAVGGITGLGSGVASFLATPSSANLATAVTGETGTGALVFGTGPTITLGNATGLPISTGVSGLGTGIATALAVNTGSAGAPVLLNGAGGTPASLVGTNITGTASGLTAGAASAVAVGGITGLGTGVGTALAINVGSAGAPVVLNGALGTPSSGTLTSATGLPEGGLSLTDITTNNVSITKHGFAPKGDNNSAHFLDGTGAYSTPAGGGNVSNSGTPVANQLAIWSAATTVIGDSDLTFSGTRLTSTDLTVTSFPTFSAGTATRVPFFSTAGLMADSSALVYNSGTGALSATSFTGGGTGLTGTAASLTAGAVTNGVTAASAASGAGVIWQSGGADKSAVASNTLGTIGITTANVTTLTLSAALQLFADPAPTTGTAGYTAFDTNAWGSGRGAIQVYDGTSNTFVVAPLASDTPVDGEVPTWHTGGTVTWDAVSGGGTGANPTASVGLSAVNGVATTFLRSDGAPALSQAIAPTWTGVHTFSPALRTSGVASYLTLNAPADTGITAATESIGLNNVTATRTWADGTVALQRERLFAGMTYNKTTTSAVFTRSFNSVFTANTAGTGVTFSEPHTLGVLDSTSASSSITGGLVVAATFGTTATSVGIGGGNINAGGAITGNSLVAGTVTTTGAGITGSTGLSLTASGSANSMTFNAGLFSFSGLARSSGITPYFNVAPNNDTGITASTESNGVLFNTQTRSWATTGTVALQRDFRIIGITHASASASQTFTDVFSLYVDAPIAGTNAIFTRGHTLGIVDSTSSTDSITGGLIVATTLGTTATSVGIGGGNVNAGGSITAGGALSIGTSNSATVGTIELGAASDTTLSRVSAGVIAVEGSTLAKIADTYGTHLGTFASPNTAAGAITWTSPVYNIYTSAGSTRTYTLPAASSYSGQAFILNVAVGTGHVNVQPASGAALVLAGTLLTADHYVQATTSAPGNYIVFISDGTNWTSLGSSGTWTDQASP